MYKRLYLKKNQMTKYIREFNLKEIQMAIYTRVFLK